MKQSGSYHVHFARAVPQFDFFFDFLKRFCFSAICVVKRFSVLLGLTLCFYGDSSRDDKTGGWEDRGSGGGDNIV